MLLRGPVTSVSWYTPSCLGNCQYTLKEALVASIILHLLMFSAAGVQDIHGQCSPLYYYGNISTLESPTSAISLVSYFSIYHVAQGNTAAHFLVWTRLHPQLLQTVPRHGLQEVWT